MNMKSEIFYKAPFKQANHFSKKQDIWDQKYVGGRNSDW
jgi:hypothetical protein